MAALQELNAHSGFDASLVESELETKIFYACKHSLRNRDTPRSRKHPPQLHSGRALTTEVKTDDVIKANMSVKEKKRPRVRELLHGVVLKSSLPAFMRISCKSMGNVLKEYF